MGDQKVHLGFSVTYNGESQTNFLANPIYSTVLLTTVSMLYARPPELTHLTNESLYPLTSVSLFTHHGQRSLVGCSPWGRYELDTTEWLHFHFSLSCIGEGNGNPLQYSCLESPRDGRAWWAAVYGVTQSRTRLKQLSISISSSPDNQHPTLFLWVDAFRFHIYMASYSICLSLSDLFY